MTYKESGIEWIGQIPIHWNTLSVSKAYQVTLGKMLQPNLNDERDVKVPYLKAMNVQDGYLSLNKIEEMYCSVNELKSLNLEVGDLVVCEGGEVARSAIIKEKLEGFIFQNSVHRVKGSKKGNTKFLHYLLTTLRDSGYINILVNKATIAHFTKDKFNSLKIALPSLNEQLIISDYLDDKFDKVENLIKAKQKLIALLEQQRQSIITEAVTKGLNPNVKMKDSGVEWIGEVPEHWETKALKYCFKVGNGKEIDIELDKEDDTGINVYGSGGVFKKTDKVLFDGESVLFGRKGTIGKPLYVNDAFWTVDTMYYTKFYKDSNPKWFYYLLLVYPWDMIVTQTALPSIVGSDVANTVCAIPSFEEQVEIAEYLSLKDGKYFKVIASINNQIHKLKEYRQALIYEAVTGKIDVRNLELN